MTSEDGVPTKLMAIPTDAAEKVSVKEVVSAELAGIVPN